ncbi:metallophosphoesterase [Patescibacteria group bacterium]|nr:metallophosphoesterase [Patescibacteria group bacterium]
MKIAIISDSHDNITNIYKFLDYAKKQNVEMIIHCGDVCAPSVLKELGDKFGGQIHLVYGNVDGDKVMMEKIAQSFNHFTIHGEIGKVDVDGKKIVLTHFLETARELAETGKYNYVFYGHNHKPWQELVGNTQLINPGTLAGLFAKATFALWDTKDREPKLILLEQI